MRRDVRRHWLSAIAVVAAFVAFCDGTENVPCPVSENRSGHENIDGRLARVGLMTDTHVTEDPARFVRVKAALELFRDVRVEMIVNCGDVGDCYCIPGYRTYRKTFNEVYPDAASRPKEVYVYANHDLYKSHQSPAEAFARMKDALEAPNGPVAAFSWKGFPFLVFPQMTGQAGFPSWTDYEAAVAKACRENPGKPVFVIDHVPPAGTTFHSRHWGSAESRRVLDKYPQVVSISGHVHGSLACERQIWQGAFTAVNAGCLYTWGGFASGSTPPAQAKDNYGVLVMDVFPDRLEFARYDVRDRSEQGPKWVVPLPFASADAPYRPENAAQRLPRPAFASGAAVTVTPEGEGYRVSFDGAGTGPEAFLYRIEVAHRAADGRWTVRSRDETFGEFWKVPGERSGRLSFHLDAALFDPGAENRVTVTPLNCFYRSGEPIAATVRAEVPLPLLLWRDDRPMEDCTFTEYGKPVERTESGCFAPPSGQGTLHLPDHVFAGLKPGTAHRLVLEIDSNQPDGDWCGWRVTLNARGRKNPLATVQNAAGAPGPLRYVFSFKVPKKGLDSCDILFNLQSPGSSLHVLSLELR